MTGGPKLAHSSLIGIQWTDLQYLYLGYTHASRYGWSSRATVELFSAAFTAEMALEIYQASWGAHADNCSINLQ